jgi:hypothetical protein
MVDLGPWTLDLGPWTLDLGPWTLDLGPWTLDLGPWMYPEKLSFISNKTEPMYPTKFVWSHLCDVCNHDTKKDPM